MGILSLVSKEILSDKVLHKNLAMVVQLTTEQIEELQEAFSLFDKDGDGTITTSELATVMRSLGQRLAEDELKRMVKEVDVDGNGTVEFPEFLAMLARKIDSLEMELLNADCETELITAFHEYDENDDGFITAKQLKQAIQNFADKLSEEDIDEMIQEADVCDENGRVNYSKFVKAMTLY